MSGNTGVLSVPCRRMFETWHRAVCEHGRGVTSDTIETGAEQSSGHSKDDDRSSGDTITEHNMD